jgi:predicted RNA-binding protein with PIN domain
MYLIDGNNVIGQRASGYETWFQDKTAARHRLIEELAQFARVKKARLTVVFDGMPDERFDDDARYRGVRILFAAPGSDADTRIVELAEREKNKRALTVVTSDNQLANRVRVCGVQVIRSGAFRHLMNEAAETEASKYASQASVAEEEMGDWMRYFGVDEGDE